MDAGSGSLTKLARQGVLPNDLSCVLLSHAHLDHIADLLPLLFYTAMPHLRFGRTLRVHTGPGFSTYFHGLEAVFGHWLKPRDGEVEVIEHEQGAFVEDGLNISVERMDHHPTSIGFRIEHAGAALVYSGDTAACPELVELARDADVAILDCSFPDDKEAASHMTVSQAARVAAEAGVGKLVLSHMYPECDGVDLMVGCRMFFQGAVHIAADGDEIAVSHEP